MTMFPGPVSKAVTSSKRSEAGKPSRCRYRRCFAPPGAPGRPNRTQSAKVKGALAADRHARKLLTCTRFVRQ